MKCDKCQNNEHRWTPVKTLQLYSHVTDTNLLPPPSSPPRYCLKEAIKSQGKSFYSSGDTQTFHWIEKLTISVTKFYTLNSKRVESIWNPTFSWCYNGNVGRVQPVLLNFPAGEINFQKSLLIDWMTTWNSRIFLLMIPFHFSWNMKNNSVLTAVRNCVKIVH